MFYYSLAQSFYLLNILYLFKRTRFGSRLCFHLQVKKHLNWCIPYYSQTLGTTGWAKSKKGDFVSRQKYVHIDPRVVLIKSLHFV